MRTLPKGNASMRESISSFFNHKFVLAVTSGILAAVGMAFGTDGFWDFLANPPYWLVQLFC